MDKVIWDPVYDFGCNTRWSAKSKCSWCDTIHVNLIAPFNIILSCPLTPKHSFQSCSCLTLNIQGKSIVYLLIILEVALLWYKMWRSDIHVWKVWWAKLMFLRKVCKYTVTILSQCKRVIRLAAVRVCSYTIAITTWAHYTKYEEILRRSIDAYPWEKAVHTSNPSLGTLARFSEVLTHVLCFK